MLTDTRFWVGAIVGAIMYHMYMSYRAKKSGQ